ncbi:hypothetical protein HPP92_010408 [Vanilla planifolia]|uniref:Uncharacterized protein n=1 Tax=Vanilla planifolia TaxID=51239 RepID=A0A835R533_VANPL|nr:hypothetical protein HPP92_010700 [Vanilla planifolia]KAG0482324.1 hypothetical protein HPP92_010408 [Vanilla planifolia]
MEPTGVVEDFGMKREYFIVWGRTIGGDASYAAAKAEITVRHGDPTGTDDFEEAMGAALPMGRMPKSRARIPKSSMSRRGQTKRIQEQLKFNDGSGDVSQIAELRRPKTVTD